jgi:hypothetical protein
MPKQLDPQRFQCAVKALALCRAKTAVVAQILANGEKVSQFSCREINEKRQADFEANMDELISKALVDVWRLPQFARYRQQQTQPQPQPGG